MKVMLECLFLLARFSQILSGRFKELFLAAKYSSLLLKIIYLHDTNSEFQMDFNSCVSCEVAVSNEFSSANVSDHVYLVAFFFRKTLTIKDYIKGFFSFWAQKLYFSCINALFYLHFKSMWFTILKSTFYSLAHSSDLYSFIK